MRIGADAGKRVGTIAIDRIGAETATAALQAYDDLLSAQHLAAVYVELPLFDPGTPALCEAFERRGAYFAGLAPWMLGGQDALRLQHVAVPVDPAKLSIFSPFGRELLAYIESERRRVGAA